MKPFPFSRTLKQLPNRTAEMRNYLDNMPADKLRYTWFAAQENVTEYSPARQRYKKFQVNRAVKRNDVSIDPMKKLL